MDGCEVARRARVALRELALDPAHPFRVQAAPTLPDARRQQVRAAMVGAGWGDLDDRGRSPLARALVAALDAAGFDALLEATVAARCAQEPDAARRWTGTWARWRSVLDDESERRLSPPQVDADKRASQRGTLLAILRERGPKGALNTELNTAVGFRYSARIAELREDGYEIRTDQVAARVFRFCLVAEPVVGRQLTMEAA